MHIGTVSRFWLRGRSWRFKIHFWRTIMHFRKSYICSNKLDVQETNISFSQPFCWTVTGTAIWERSTGTRPGKASNWECYLSNKQEDFLFMYMDEIMLADNIENISTFLDNIFGWDKILYGKEFLDTSVINWWWNSHQSSTRESLRLFRFCVVLERSINIPKSNESWKDRIGWITTS